MDQTKNDKIEALRQDIAANHPELLERFNEIHPIPVLPLTLVEALTSSVVYQSHVSDQTTGTYVRPHLPL